MITVAGEALIDLIVDPAGHVDPRMGGGPFNVTRAVARLGQPAAFLGRLSADRFGQLMRADLERHGVQIAVEAPADEPTTLALVDVDPTGVPGYHFYLAGTSAAAIGPGEAVRLDRILRRADVVKTSTEDLAYLFPGQDAWDGAAQLLARGPACVVVTDGAAPARAFTAGGQQIRADVPAAPVVDTVGAGDAFGGAFLTWWTGKGLGRADLADAAAVRGATQAAIHA